METNADRKVAYKKIDELYTQLENGLPKDFGALLFSNIPPCTSLAMFEVSNYQNLLDLVVVSWKIDELPLFSGDISTTKNGSYATINSNYTKFPYFLPITKKKLDHFQHIEALANYSLLITTTELAAHTIFTTFSNLDITPQATEFESISRNIHNNFSLQETLTEAPSALTIILARLQYECSLTDAQHTPLILDLIQWLLHTPATSTPSRLQLFSCVPFGRWGALSNFLMPQSLPIIENYLLPVENWKINKEWFRSVLDEEVYSGGCPARNTNFFHLSATLFAEIYSRLSRCNAIT